MVERIVELHPKIWPDRFWRTTDTYRLFICEDVLRQCCPTLDCTKQYKVTITGKASKGSKRYFITRCASDVRWAKRDAPLFLFGELVTELRQFNPPAWPAKRAVYVTVTPV